MWKSLGGERRVPAPSRLPSLSRDLRLRSVLALECEMPPLGVGKDIDSGVDLGVGTGLRMGLSASRSTDPRRFVERRFSSSGSGVTFNASRRARLRVVDSLSVMSTSPKSGSSCASELS